MRLSHLKIQSFLGIRHLDTPLTALNLIAGFNGSGKSSVENAIRLAVTGDLPRVALKKELGAVVHEGAKAASIELTGDTGSNSIQIQASGTAKGILNEEDTPWWAHALTDPTYLSSLDPTALRKCLFSHSGGTSTPEVVKRLIQGGAEAGLVESITPLLRNFEAAEKEAEGRAKEARGEWKGITGETYGEVKAETWAAAVPEVVKVADRSAELRTDVDQARQAIANANAAGAQRLQVERSLADAREAVPMVKRHQDALEPIQRDIAKERAEVEKLERLASGQALPKPAASHPCPECGSFLHILPDHSLIGEAEYDEKAKAAPDLSAKAKLAEHQKALDMLLRSLENRQRDLKAAQAIAGQVGGLEGQLKAFGKLPDTTKLQAVLNGAQATYDAHMAEIGKAKAAQAEAATAADKTFRAGKAHQAVKAWSQIKALLSPDGIPAQFLDGVLKEANDRLRTSAERTAWGQVQIHPDMRITYGGRALGLCSESERWRASAMLTEAVAWITGEKFILLDRLDVLGVEQRGVALDWFDALVSDGTQVIAFATLKAKPSVEGATVVWLERGQVG